MRVDKIKNSTGKFSYWKTAHNDWRFWVGFVFILIALGVYIMSGDLTWW